MPTVPFSKRSRQKHPRFTRIFLLTSCFFMSFGAGFAYASWAMVCRGGRCPPAEALDGYEPRQTSKIFAADGRFIAELGLERRTLVKYDSIPQILRNAFIAIEDKRFWNHTGIDWQSVPRAVLADIKNRNFKEGFSTISMQLARNIFPERISRDKNLIRKLKEAKVARAIEDKYSKEKIIELYLNQINFGAGAYGVVTASQRYFGKPLKDLNVAEVAMLAGLPKAPERYNPRSFPDRAIQRRNTVIAVMREEKVIDPAAASEAQAYPLRLAPRVESGDVAPYFVEWIRQQLDDQFGRQLYEQGLKVYTTLDLDLQTAGERALERQIRAIESGRFGSFPHKSYERYMAQTRNDDDAPDSPNSPYLQGAFIAMDPRTGAIRALVGGRDFDDSKFNRAVQAVRQPGSTFKPLVYAAGVQSGRPLSYLLDDSPLEVRMSGSDTWKPQNFDGGFVGRLPLRRALYQSRNVPTIRLGLELGVQAVIDEARKFGITTPIPGYPSILIGAADVYPIEMVAAYSTFATLGNRASPIAIMRVEDQAGTVLWEPQPTIVPVLSQEEAWLMVSVMKDVVQRGTAAGSVGSSFRYPAGGKTGTTNDGTDVWYIGYTSDLVAGVWMGFDKPKKIKSNAQGGVLAAPAWTAFMTEVYKRKPAPRDWPMPQNIITQQIDVGTNMLATAFCPSTAVGNEFFIPGTDPIMQCDVHTGSTLYPDTSGIAGYPSTYPTSPYPVTTTSPGQIIVDTTRTQVIIPGQVNPSRPPRPITDTSRRARDSAMFALPPRDTSMRVTRPRDTTRLLDSLRRRPGDTLVRPRPDTIIRPRPDSIRPRPDTIRPRPDTIRPRPDTTRPPSRNFY